MTRPTCHMMMAQSLDGFIARPDHGLDWLLSQPTEGEDHGFEYFYNFIDVLVMGSGSFRNVLKFDEFPYDKAVVVLSHSMTTDDIPAHLREQVSITTKSPEQIVDDLGYFGVKRIYVDGGAVGRSFIAAGLVQDIKLTQVPILIGKGIRLFADLGRDIHLELVSATPFQSGLVDCVYKFKY